MTEPVDPTAAAVPAGGTHRLHARCCAAAALPSSLLPAGTRRRRLWALGPHAHCPVVGVCLPLAAMRRLARKVLGAEPIADDYALHCGMVAECKQRTGMAEAVQRELDRRFMLPLRRAAAMKTEVELAAWWQVQVSATDLPGALWATLTHARCTPALEHQVLGQVHMIQHQVGMASRVELARFEALIDENAVLTRALAGAQQRSMGLVRERAEHIDGLQAEVVRLRGQSMAAQSAAALLQEDLQALRQSVPNLASRERLTEREVQQGERLQIVLRALQEARREINQLREQLEAQAPPAEAARAAQQDHVAAGATQRPLQPLAQPAAGPVVLADRAVLCVGGRTASVPVYRRLIERQGARFLHHDGGEEHSAAQLESTLAAADLVICQVGCVSHNAYWRVKDHCKRTGKRCIFVDTPSATSLQRALTDPALTRSLRDPARHAGEP